MLIKELVDGYVNLYDEERVTESRDLYCISWHDANILTSSFSTWVVELLHSSRAVDF